MSKVWYFSHSRSESDSYCKRKRYLGSEWGGTGLEPIQGGWDLQFGNVIHKYLDKQAMGAGFGYDDIRKEVYQAGLDTLSETQAKDYATLAEGLLRGFIKTIWPGWLNQYEVCETEKLRSWEVEDNHVFRFKQDILLRDKSNGQLVYPDYKTTSSDSPQWIASWTKSPQLHSSAYALLRGYGLDINHMFVQGLYKGYKDKKTGHLSSIFSRGWVNREYAMSPSYSYTYKNYKGWEPFYTFDEFDSLENWVNNMPLEILAAQFPRTAPIYPRKEIAETYFRQQMYREREVKGALEDLASPPFTDTTIDDILDEHFPQDFHKCTPAYGFDCEFKDLCWIPYIEADPLGSGLFKQRIPQNEDMREEPNG